MTGIWLLSVVVIINAYSGVLTSLLTVTKLKPIAETMKDVADSKELRVTCEKSSALAAIFLVLPFQLHMVFSRSIKHLRWFLIRVHVKRLSGKKPKTKQTNRKKTLIKYFYYF